MFFVFGASGLTIFNRSRSFRDSGAKHAAATHIHHAARRHQQAPVEGKTDIDQVIDFVCSAKSGELGPIGRDALGADRARGRRKIKLGETGGDIGRIVGARRALRGPEFLQALVHWIGREGC